MTRTLVPIDSLREDPINLRLHPVRNLEAIVASLQRFGQQKPVVHKAGTVIAGNGLLLGARQLRWTEVWAEESDLLTDADLLLYAIADNRTAELAEWDYDQLAAQAMELERAGVALAPLGWEDWELAPILANARDKGSDKKPRGGSHTIRFSSEHWETVGAAIEAGRAAWASDLGDAECIRRFCASFVERAPGA